MIETTSKNPKILKGLAALDDESIGEKQTFKTVKVSNQQRNLSFISNSVPIQYSTYQRTLN